MRDYLALGTFGADTTADEMYNKAIEAIFSRNVSCHRITQQRPTRKMQTQDRWILFEMWPLLDPVSGWPVMMVTEQNITQVRASCSILLPYHIPFLTPNCALMRPDFSHVPCTQGAFRVRAELSSMLVRCLSQRWNVAALLAALCASWCPPQSQPSAAARALSCGPSGSFVKYGTLILLLWCPQCTVWYPLHAG